ncbi:tRNA-splicing ligase RtcB-like [Acipenser ruthenus]|uniref:3'-phosphate/5'-hydroxy nucleic acid ligase n=1 Tax=Acipenser ruthenus TaxID=7906 RepID=A0A662YWB1_ACIRT|nr:tRNA-splicing ligase RtcB-like [Acipenser ruthenus]
MSRSYNDELQYLDKISKNCWRIKKGFVPNMQVEGVFYVNDPLEKLMFEELRNACRGGGFGGFLPAMKQIGNVAALPGIVHRSIGLPDVHSGYGFAIGNMAAFDMDNPDAVVSPEFVVHKQIIEHHRNPADNRGRAMSRSKSRRNLDFQDVLDSLADQGIAIRVASPKLVMEESKTLRYWHQIQDTAVRGLNFNLFFSQAPESYKNVTDVVNTCHDAGISKKAIKLRPIAVIKG